MAGDSGDDVAEVRCGRGGGDPGAYAAALKRKLDLYCVAVAKSMEARSQDSLLGYPNLQASVTSPLISQASDTSQLISQASFDDNTDSQNKPANTDIPKEQSDDDADFGETADPANAKKMKRMLSNRESARRSRKRKQTHLSDLESQVSRLSAENVSLLKRLADMTEKYKDAALDNRNLTVHVESMRRKVHIAEEAVRRVTGASILLLPTTSDMAGSSMPLSSCASDAASAAIPVEDIMQYFLQSHDDQIKIELSNETTPLKRVKTDNMAASSRRVASLEKTDNMAASSRRVASLENLQRGSMEIQ